MAVAGKVAGALGAAALAAHAIHKAVRGPQWHPARIHDIPAEILDHGVMRTVDFSNPNWQHHH